MTVFKFVKMSLKRKNYDDSAAAAKKECFGPPADAEFQFNFEDIIEVDLPVDIKEEIDPLSTDQESFFKNQTVKTELDEIQGKYVEPVAQIHVYAARKHRPTHTVGITKLSSSTRADSPETELGIQPNIEISNIPNSIKIKLDPDDEEGSGVIDLTDDMSTDEEENIPNDVVAGTSSSLKIPPKGPNIDTPKEIGCAIPEEKLRAIGTSSLNNSSTPQCARELSPLVDTNLILAPITERFNPKEEDGFCEAFGSREHPQGSSKIFSVDDWGSPDQNEPESILDSVRSFSPTEEPSDSDELISSENASEEAEQFSADAFTPVSVKILLQHPPYSGFWTSEQENVIFSQPVPLSQWDRTTTYNPEHIFLSDFDFSKFPWLCDSPELKKFYCWPCLLCGNQADLWSMDMTPSPSKANSNDFEEAFVDHQVTLMHLNSQATYESRQKVAGSLQTNRSIERIQMLWRELVKTLCCERKNNERFKLENHPSLSTHVQYILSEIFQRRISLMDTSQLSSKILEFALKYIKSKIIDEVRDSQFVTLHVEDLAPFVTDRSWLVVIARYIDKNGCIQERVIDFARSTLAKLPRSGEAVIRWLRHLFLDYRLSENVVGFSHSASLVAPTSIYEFRRAIMSWCPRAMFYHPPGHHLFNSIFRAISHISEGRRYLRDVKEVCEFMNKNPSVLQYKTNGFFPVPPLPKPFDISLAGSLKMHYSTLLTIFQRMVNLGRCDPEMEAQARKFVRFLQGPKDRILIVLVGLICSTCADFATALETSTNVTHLKNLRAKSINTLKIIQAYGLKSINGTAGDPTLAKVVYDVSPKYVLVFNQVIQLTIDFLIQGFEDMMHYTFTKSELLECTLKLTNYPVLSPDFIARVKLSPIQSNQLKLLISSPHSPQFVDTLNHHQLLQYIINLNKTKEYAGLYSYLLFVHTVTTNISARQQLLATVCEFIASAPEEVTPNYLSGYSWKVEDAVFNSIIEDPGLYEKSLQTCMLKIVVENDSDVKVVEYVCSSLEYIF